MNKGDIKKIIFDSKKLNPYERKLDFLKGKFKGQTCYVLGCGPSLKDIDKHKLQKEVEDKALFTIKQSYFSFKDYVDFHFFNTNNYSYYSDNPNALFLGSSDWLTEAAVKDNIWKLQQIDICTSVAGAEGQNLSLNKPMSKLQYLDDFDLHKYSFEETGLKRKWGAGIMYELVLFFIHHLGFSEIKVAGWDYADPNKKGMLVPEHFYEEEHRLRTLNPCFPAYPEEMLDSINLANRFNAFFKSNEVELKVHKSDKCFLTDEIERYVL